MRDEEVLILGTVAALAVPAAVAAAEWIYEGQWGRFGTANGRFDTSRAV